DQARATNRSTTSALSSTADHSGSNSRWSAARLVVISAKVSAGSMTRDLLLCAVGLRMIIPRASRRKVRPLFCKPDSDYNSDEAYGYACDPCPCRDLRPSRRAFLHCRFLNVFLYLPVFYVTSGETAPFDTCLEAVNKGTSPRPVLT